MSRRFGVNHPAFQWIRSSGGSVPPNAVQGGFESDGRPLFIGRTMFKGSLIPGKIAPHLNGILVSYDGKEHTEKDYEVLVGDARLLQWKECYGRLQIQGWAPLECGHEQNGTELFVCKTRLHGGEVIGKVSVDMAGGMAYGYDCKEKYVGDTNAYYVLTVPQQY